MYFYFDIVRVARKKKLEESTHYILWSLSKISLQQLRERGLCEVENSVDYHRSIIPCFVFAFSNLKDARVSTYEANQEDAQPSSQVRGTFSQEIPKRRH